MAEIKPCIAVISALSKKVKNHKEVPSSILKEMNISNISVYPTLFIDNQITIETQGIEFVNYSLIDLQGKLILNSSFYSSSNNNYKKEIMFPNLISGLYFLILNDGTDYKTIKLMKK